LRHGQIQIESLSRLRHVLFFQMLPSSALNSKSTASTNSRSHAWLEMPKIGAIVSPTSSVPFAPPTDDLDIGVAQCGFPCAECCAIALGGDPKHGRVS